MYVCMYTYIIYIYILHLLHLLHLLLVVSMSERVSQVMAEQLQLEARADLVTGYTTPSSSGWTLSPRNLNQWPHSYHIDVISCNSAWICPLLSESFLIPFLIDFERMSNDLDVQVKNLENPMDCHGLSVLSNLVLYSSAMWKSCSNRLQHAQTVSLLASEGLLDFGETWHTTSHNKSTKQWSISSPSPPSQELSRYFHIISTLKLKLQKFFASQFFYVVPGS